MVIRKGTEEDVDILFIIKVTEIKVENGIGPVLMNDS